MCKFQVSEYATSQAFRADCATRMLTATATILIGFVETPSIIRNN
jgi:hypothetical protein